VQPIVYYPTFIATALSVAGLTYLAIKEHQPENPRTLSVIATSSKSTLRYFQIVLWLCGTLFAISMYFYVIPRARLPLWQTIAWTATYTSEMLLAFLHAANETEKVHNLLSFIMGAGMLSSAYIFTAAFQNMTQHVELAIAVTMTLLGGLTFLDNKRYIFYELPFIFLAHISILVASISLAS
jgi:hypothetical protein